MALKINGKHSIMILQDEIKRSELSRYDHRLHAVLMVAQGMRCPRVAEILGDSERTVRYWASRFNEEGLPGLVEVDRPGRPCRLTEKQMTQIGKALRKTPAEVGLRGNLWDGTTLSRYIHERMQTKISTRQCQRIFRHLGFRLRKPRPLIAQADPDAQKAFKKNCDA